MNAPPAVNRSASGDPSYTTVLLRGGLGNQMFQYAAGLVVARRTATRLRLDATAVDADQKRSYELDLWKINPEVVRQAKEDAAIYSDSESTRAAAANLYGATLVEQGGNRFGDELAQAPPNAFLSGYWQSERYIAPVVDTLRAEFRLRSAGRTYRKFKRQIDRTRNAIAVHVRRGDFSEDESARAAHGLCPAEYFQTAAKMLNERTGGGEFFVFTDDPDWCRQNLALPGVEHLVSGKTSAAEDITLIARCRHCVVSNSSFGWWGAWLGESADTQVVAPKSWFAGLEYVDADYVPRRWLRL